MKFSFVTILRNPFYLYVFIFLFVLLVYSLGWSDLYPELSWKMKLFLFSTFSISLIAGFFTQHLKLIRYNKVSEDSNIKYITALILAGYSLEFLHKGGVPLLLVFNDPSYHYKDFGIPTFHVFLVTFSSFYTIYIFHVLLENKTKWLLLLFIINLSLPILLYNRGMFIINMVSCILIVILKVGKLKTAFLLKTSALIFVVFYFFGILGNIRLTKGLQSHSKYIMEVSKANDKLKESFIPNEYIWGYLYISSPLANFQNTTEKSKVDEYDLIGLTTMEFIPDFISKRISSITGIKRKRHIKIVHWLTVGTFYSYSYSYAEWWGPILMFIFFLLYIFTSLLLMNLKKQSVYSTTGIAILNSIVIFNTFDNMITFTGLSFQLVYPIIFGFFKKISIIYSSKRKATINPTEN